MTKTNFELNKMEADKNRAYWERDQLVAALSKIYPAHLSRHSKKDKTWEDDWRNIVCIHIPVWQRNYAYPAGPTHFSRSEQVTWHIHDSELVYFSHLEKQANHWDGHTTEDKYDRLRHLDVPKPKRKGFLGLFS
jgi:hypothetical protein